MKGKSYIAEGTVTAKFSVRVFGRAGDDLTESVEEEVCREGVGDLDKLEIVIEDISEEYGFDEDDTNYEKEV